MHLNMSHSEVKSLPVRYRRWYLERLVRHFKEKNEIRENAKNKNSDKNSDTNKMNAFNAYQQDLNNKFK